MQNEQWKDIRGYEGLYQISDHGRVKSFVVDKYEGRILRPKVTVQGYQAVMFNDRTQHLVHRLVGKAFVENPHGYKEIDHISNRKTENHYSNLQWTCTRDNVQKDQADFILCRNENGTQFVVNGTRAAAEATSCWRGSVQYALKHDTVTRTGWRFTVVKKSNV